MPIRRRTLAVFAVLPALLIWLVLPMANAGAGVTAEVPAAAMANGTVLHADALRAGSTTLADVEVATSGSAFDRAGFLKPLLNELGRQFVPKAGDKTSFGRGAGLEVGLGITPADENQLILAGTAERGAPPRLGAVTKEIGPVDAAPLAWVDLLRGQAGANTTATPCALGVNTSNGLGYIGDLQLLDTNSDDKLKPEVGGLVHPLVALDGTDPARSVSQSRSVTQFISQRDKDGKLIGSNFGVMSEVRQTFAPVTLFRGTDDELTIELLGEWVLQSVSMGIPGKSFVHYGPAKATPETPVVRIVRPDGVENILTLQQVFTNEGLVVTIPGLAEIAIGEPVRAIGGAAGSKPFVAPDGTKAAAAVDIVRVRTLAGAPNNQIADLRLGHMETQSQVPAGGASCAIPVKKTPSVTSVDVGETFGVDFTITNPYDCTLKAVKLDDVITTEGGARFEVASTEPAAETNLVGSLTEGTLGWTSLADLKPGQTRTVHADFIAKGVAGEIVDTASAAATLADCAEEGASVAGVIVGVVGTGLDGVSTAVRSPVEIGVLSASSDDNRLPKTGAEILGLVLSGLGLIGLGTGGVVLHRRMR
jgi:LPXTG-motif cell wall-anchored protein